jgi:hypothetical protein
MRLGDPVSKRFKDNEREEVINIKTHSNSANASQDVRIVRNDIRTNNPRLRTIHDLRFRDVLVTHSRSTR